MDLDAWADQQRDASTVLRIPPDTIARFWWPASAGTAEDPAASTVYHRRNPLSVRYLNDAYVWSLVLCRLGLPDSPVVEVAVGRSLTVHVALGFAGFAGTYHPVDRRHDPVVARAAGRLARAHAVRPVELDVVEAPERLPRAGGILLNHALDDLYVGRWAQENDVRYFETLLDDPQRSRRCWEAAMTQAHALIPELERALRAMVRRLSPGGLFVMRNYPSAYETHFALVDRVRFTAELAERCARAVRREGLTEIPLDLDTIGGAPGSKYPRSFRAFRRAAAAPGVGPAAP